MNELIADAMCYKAKTVWCARYAIRRDPTTPFAPRRSPPRGVSAPSRNRSWPRSSSKMTAAKNSGGARGRCAAARAPAARAAPVAADSTFQRRCAAGANQ
ncbi:unnamed protein product, partial [Iphiclides podalirius]